MDWQTAPLAACLDYLAECKGWKKSSRDSLWRHDGDAGSFVREGLIEHPIPATLDSIAGCLPNGIVWFRIGRSHRQLPINPATWFASVLYNGETMDETTAQANGITVKDDMDAMLLAMARCACMAWDASRAHEKAP